MKDAVDITMSNERILAAISGNFASLKLVESAWQGHRLVCSLVEDHSGVQVLGKCERKR